jgi:hypothetical protein
VVGIVVVSHSAALAEGVVELARQMARYEFRLEAAGGLEDGSIGTDVERGSHRAYGRQARAVDEAALGDEPRDVVGDAARRGFGEPVDERTGGDRVSGEPLPSVHGVIRSAPWSVPPLANRCPTGKSEQYGTVVVALPQ